MPVHEFIEKQPPRELGAHGFIANQCIGFNTLFINVCCNMSSYIRSIFVDIIFGPTHANGHNMSMCVGDRKDCKSM